MFTQQTADVCSDELQRCLPHASIAQKSIVLLNEVYVFLIMLLLLLMISEKKEIKL